MRGNFTRYFAVVEFSDPFIYKSSFIIAVLIVAFGASRVAYLSKTGSYSAWVSVPTRVAHSLNPVYSSIDMNSSVPEDDKLTTGKFTEFAGQAVLTDFKRDRFGVIDKDIDDFVYSINSFPHNSSLGFTPLRSPPHLC